MFENLEKLETLRSQRRSTLAKAVLEILDFCDDNGFQNCYKTRSICYSTAYSGQYAKVLIIKEFNDDYVGISIDSTDRNENYLKNNMVCNSEKRHRIGGYTESWLTPKMNEVKDWIEKTRKEIEERIQKEIEWLENW